MIQSEIKNLKLISIVFPLMLLIVSLSELPIVPFAQSPEYYAGKLFFALLVSFLSLALIKYRNDTLVILIGVAAFSYTAFSQLYRPLYFIGFVQTTCFYPLLVPVKQKHFILTLTISGIIFILAFLYSIEINPTSFQSISKSDIITTVITTGLIGLVLNSRLEKNRVFYGEAMERFSVIGEVSTAIAHNVKGMMAAPLFDLETLERDLESNGDLHRSQKVKRIYNKIESSESALRDMNYISHVAYEKNEWLILNKSVENVARLLNIESKKIEIHQKLENQIYADKRHIEAVLAGLFLNSLKSFKAAKPPNPAIEISNKGNEIIFKDNGPGFSDEIAEKLNQGEYLAHEKVSGGLGITLLRRTVERMGGTIRFYNDDGANIAIKLPPNRFRKV